MSNQEHLIRSIEDAFSNSGDDILISKRAVKAFGWDKAIYISLMMEKSRLHVIKQGTDWFLYKNNDLLEDAQFGNQNRNKLNKLKKYFEDSGVIESKIEGIPSKQWFKTNPLRLSELIEEMINSSDSKQFNALKS